MRVGGVFDEATRPQLVTNKSSTCMCRSMHTSKEVPNVQRSAFQSILKPKGIQNQHGIVEIKLRNQLLIFSSRWRLRYEKGNSANLNTQMRLNPHHPNLCYQPIYVSSRIFAIRRFWWWASNRNAPATQMGYRFRCKGTPSSVIVSVVAPIIVLNFSRAKFWWTRKDTDCVRCQRGVGRTCHMGSIPCCCVSNDITI